MIYPTYTMKGTKRTGKCLSFSKNLFNYTMAEVKLINQVTSLFILGLVQLYKFIQFFFSFHEVTDRRRTLSFIASFEYNMISLLRALWADFVSQQTQSFRDGTRPSDMGGTPWRLFPPQSSFLEIITAISNIVINSRHVCTLALAFQIWHGWLWLICISYCMV